MAVLEDRRLRSPTVRKFAVAVVIALPLAVALAQGVNESVVKAAFLYHFTGYVDYPASAFTQPSAPFVIGVLGKDTIMDALQQAVRGKSVKGRPVVVKQVGLGQELKECHVLFVPEAQAANLSRVLDVLGDAPVLLVGESKDFAAKGGMIGFFVEQNRVRFEINPEAARRAHLTISSKLLSLARIVKESRRG